MSFVAGNIPILITFGPVIIVFFAINYWKKRSSFIRRNNPLNKDILRSPGETLRAQIEEIYVDITAQVALLMVMPLLMYGFLITRMLFTEKDSVGYGMIIFSILICLIFDISLLYKMIENIKRKHKLVLGHESELSIGQELNELMREGMGIPLFSGRGI